MNINARSNTLYQTLTFPYLKYLTNCHYSFIIIFVFTTQSRYGAKGCVNTLKSSRLACRATLTRDYVGCDCSFKATYILPTYYIPVVEVFRDRKNSMFVLPAFIY